MPRDESVISLAERGYASYSEKMRRTKPAITGGYIMILLQSHILQVFIQKTAALSFPSPLFPVQKHDNKLCDNVANNTQIMTDIVLQR
jgi:hypothetical protein